MVGRTAGIAGVVTHDARASSGLVNASHQLGMATGLGVLITLSAGAATGSERLTTITDHVGAALAGSSVFLAMALAIALTVIVPATHQ